MSKIKKVGPILNYKVSNQKDTNEVNDLLPKGEKSKKSEKSYSQLGSKIKELREKHNLTQISLSQQLGVTPTYVSLIEQGKKGGADKLLLKIEDFFKLKHKTLLNLRDAQNTVSIQEEKPKPKQQPQPELELELKPEHKTIPNQYPAFIQDLVDILLSYGENYAKQKVPTWIKEIQDEFFNRLTPFELGDVKQHVMTVKRNWIEETKRSVIPEENAPIVQGYIIQDEHKHFFSLQQNSHALTLNLLHSDKQSIQYFESWLGTCSISYLTSQQLPFLKTDDQVSSYLWFSPHVSITDMYSYLKNLAININDTSINEPRLNWYIHELTSEDGVT